MLTVEFNSQTFVVPVCRLYADGILQGDYESWDRAARAADFLLDNGQAVRCRLESVPEN